MVKGKWIGIVLLVAASALAVLFLYPGEEKKVRKQFSLLAHYASKDEGEKILTMAGKMKNLEALFAESCRIEAPPYSLAGTFSRMEIANLSARARLHFGRLDLAFHDLAISFPDPGTAQVVLTGEAKGHSFRGGSVHEVREIECLLKKRDGQWLFVGWEIVEVLKR
jgi:hypothetical protein